ncbi:PopZ family protein [Methylobacterium aerolatum]|uniref:Cell pole-organizing protein PopZ n=1 Tax=Methylobacterium aerolatum TaxID=418708 RepID=A0ABU0I5Q5_9HYPH|nr:DUF2497 domain-containing protein [Methylobacterium aerolatum]MDQ0449949.1 cell pole-organizing protein PopZ [Methylobacterium aerolatum]GJD37490.1 hypothetical protein FMGBMHLM_4422 [Methylobacterium aerolatum]
MSAASPQVQDKAGDKAHEPSMEEILASIRRIIADDQAAKPAEAEPAEMDDILDLAEAAEPVAAPAPKPAPKAVEPPKPVPLELEEIAFQDFAAMSEPEPEPEPVKAPPAAAPPPRAAIQPEPAPQPEPVAERLISPNTDASVSQAFNLLAHTVLSNNARTLEDIVREMLRPMLKSWLDDNLPVVVERLVRAEIERVSRGR